jgi:pimeloyl-ACP methyl ester carboxylesterase
LFGSARNWQSYARQLGARYHVIAVDQRNHGRSPHADAHDYATLADDIAALIRRLGLDEVVLLGHSMGGKAAMTLALTAPSHLARLVIVDIAPLAYADQHTLIIDAMLALPLGEIQRRQQAEQALAAAVTDPAIRMFLLQNLQFDNDRARWRLNLPALRRAMPALIGALPVSENAKFDGPVHFIRGGGSDRVRDVDLPRCRRFFPDLHVHTVAGAGHWPHAEAPAAFAACLEQALASS